jgi:hypothetical protein
LQEEAGRPVKLSDSHGMMASVTTVTRSGRKLVIHLLALVLVACACGISPFDTPQSRIEVKPDGTFTGSQMKPAEVQQLLVKQATRISPVLFPTYLTDGMSTCIANGNRDGFLVSCFGGARIFSLQTQTEDARAYKPKVLRRVSYRGDKAAEFMDANPVDVGAVKLVMWHEPSQSASSACRCVPYDLHAVGVSEDEFWKIASSLAVRGNS